MLCTHRHADRMSRRGAILFVLMSVVWGVPYLLIKVAVEQLQPSMVVFGRTAVGCLLLLPLAAARGQIRPLLGAWRWILAYTIVEVAIPWLLLSSAEQRLPSSLTGLLVAVVPLVGAVIALGLRAEDRVRGWQFGGLALGLVGVAALLGLDLPSGATTSVIEVGVVVVCYAAGPAVAARQLSHLPSLGLAAVSIGLAAALYVPAAAVQHPVHWPDDRVLVSVILLGGVCTAAAFVVFFELIREIGPSKATVITYINPAVAVTLGVAFGGDGFGWTTALGFTLILGGSVLATRHRPATPLPAIRR